MISLVVVGILVVIAIIAFKFSDLRHKATLILIVMLIGFFLGTIYLVAATNDLDFSSTDGFFDAIGIYFGWLGNAFDNMKGIVGNAIDMNWKDADSIEINKSKLGI